jgi:hypothetical protein
MNIIENGKHDFGEISYTTKKYRYVIRLECEDNLNPIYSLYRVERPDYGKGSQYFMDYVEDVTEYMEAYNW